MAQIEGGVRIDVPKGHNSIILEEIWFRSSWGGQSEITRDSIQLLRESMLRWWRRNLVREFCL